MKNFKVVFITILSFLLISKLIAENSSLYEVDLSDHSDDLFHVTHLPGELTKSDSIYRFVAFAPGAHQPLNFGRFVQTFIAFDENGKIIHSEKVSMNDYRIKNPESVYKIVYDLEDSFGAEVEGNKVFPMSGTGIEEDFILLNTFGILGYFEDHKAFPTKIKIEHPDDWIVGTALDKSSDGYYYADSYHHLCDSPFLLGELTAESTRIGEIQVEVYVFSPIEEINASVVLDIAKESLASVTEFIDYNPVDRYAFLMVFGDREMMQRNKIFGGGALEHSYSSLYTLGAFPQMLQHLGSIVAHEFMHILTPLHLHSEILANYDYSKPSIEDEHVWLYEGVTEWTSDIMQLRSGALGIDEYLKTISEKINLAEQYNPEYSLLRISKEWNTEEGNRQYANIYQLGALTATMLDIELLKISNGKQGLRDVYFELIKKYGKDRPFKNDELFDEIVKMTHPKIESFIENYIKGNKPLPFDKYFNLLGIEYFDSKPSENKKPLFGLRLGEKENRLKIDGFSKEFKENGLEENDIILKLFNEEITTDNAQEIFGMRDAKNPGDKYKIVVQRGDEELTFEGELLERIDYHIFAVSDDCSDQQKKLREIWSRNNH
jgi:predicted metalloprotease with PDZ domain